jgi:hypothetical protein
MKKNLRLVVKLNEKRAFLDKNTLKKKRKIVKLLFKTTEYVNNLLSIKSSSKVV